MGRFSNRLRALLRTSQQGMTLVELMAATAITTSIAAVVASVLFNTFSSGRILQRRTDGYESLRLVAASFTEDARFSVAVECGMDYIKLFSRWSTHYVMYKFADWDEVNRAEVADPSNLHRWEVEVIGGVLQVNRDDIVGRDLVASDGSTSSTWFGCDPSPDRRRARAHLAKSPLPGQTEGTQLEVQAHYRR